MEVVYVDIALGGIINIQLGAVWRKREPIRIFHVLCQQLKLTIQSDAIDTLKGEFLLLPARQVRSWISKVDSAIRTKHHVIGAVETLALVMVHDYFVTFAIRRQTDNRPQNTGTIQKTMLWIIGIAIRVAQRDDFLFLTSRSVYLENFVESFIAHPEIAGAIPNRPLGKAESRSQFGQLCFPIKESPKLGCKGLKFGRRLVCFSMT